MITMKSWDYNFLTKLVVVLCRQLWHSTSTSTSLISTIYFVKLTWGNDKLTSQYQFWNFYQKHEVLEHQPPSIQNAQQTHEYPITENLSALTFITTMENYKIKALRVRVIVGSWSSRRGNLHLLCQVGSFIEWLAAYNCTTIAVFLQWWFNFAPCWQNQPLWIMYGLKELSST